MNERPRIQPQLSKLDHILNNVGVFLLVLMWLVAICCFVFSPAQVPVHFNAAGEPDAWGSKLTQLLLPVIGTAIFFGLRILNKYPYIFNYPIKITEQNAVKEYARATRLLRYMIVAVLLLFITIDMTAQLIASGRINGLGAWFLPIVYIIFFVPIVVSLAYSFRDKLRNRNQQ